MESSDSREKQGAPPRGRIHYIRLLLKICALIFIVLSIVLIAWGLLPHEKIPTTEKTLQGGIACSFAIEAYKEEIITIDFEVEGSDVNFYLTYNQPWPEDSQYMIKKEHATDEHYEIDVEKSGHYYLNYESNDPTSTEDFTVHLEYKVMNRNSPARIFAGVALLVLGLLLTLIIPRIKEKPITVGTETVLG